MRGAILLALSLLIIQASQADIVYLKTGEVYAGTITFLESERIELQLSDGKVVGFRSDQVFRATDDAGNILFDGVLRANSPRVTQQELITPPIQLEESPLIQSSSEYRKVIRFPFWPLLGGTALLGYVGITQLDKSSETYQESQDLEALGLDFGATRDRSQKERSWGQICLAGAIACLIVGLTPHYEKVPVQNSLRVTPTKDGISLTLNF